MTQATVDELLRTAIGHHQAGRLAEAEQFYRQVLVRSPNHSDALNLLGVIARQCGQLQACIELTSRAVAINPKISGYHFNLGTALAGGGRLEEAISSLTQATALDAGNADAWNELAGVLFRHGRLIECIAACRKVIAIKPEFALGYSNLSYALRMIGQADEAIIAARQAIALKPDMADAYNNLGVALLQKRDFSVAIVAFDEAVRLKPDFVEAYNNLSPALRGAGRLDDAIAAARRSISLRPDYADAHNSLAAALWDKREIEEAIAECKRAIQIRPDFAQAYNNLGGILAEKGELDDSIAAYLKPIALSPGHGVLHRNLGSVYKEQGRLDEALECWRKAILLDPSDVVAGSSLVFALHYHPAYDARSILAEYRLWAQRHEQPLAGQIRVHGNDRSAERRLIIGYVSPDFRDHPAGRVLMPLLAHHDHERFEIVCYSDVHQEDAVTERLKGYSDRWRSMVGVGDAEMAEQIRQDKIDILVDTTMHMADNRLLVFARKPAPVQVTWLGYPGTTGLRSMDYRLTDSVIDPPGENDEMYCEKSIRLGHCYWCYEAIAGAPEVNQLPALKAGHLTFGCFNNYAKVTPAAIELWLKVLSALPGSGLILRCPAGSSRDAVKKAFEAAGVATERLEFVQRLATQDYLALYHRVDLCLDPIPYPGHTCTLDGLWMGVPPITLSGTTAASRGGASILSNIGLFDFVAQDVQRYVAIAVRCAGDIPALAGLRGALRQKMRTSALMDGKQFAADFESVYRQVWRAWCRG